MRNAILVAVCIAWGALASSGQADDDVYPSTPSVTLGPWVRDLEVGPKMNAAGRDLRRSEFAHQNLAGAVFDRCDLSNVEFIECNLSGASFKNAEFEDAGMIDCDLTDADFDNATVNGLETVEKHLSEKQLKSTRSYRTKDLSNCTIGGSRMCDSVMPCLNYDFRGMTLVNARLLAADFRQCDFTEAGIGGVRIARARIKFAQIASTQTYRHFRGLWNIEFSGADQLPGSEPIMDGEADFRGVDLTGITISGGALARADWRDAKISRGTFVAGGITVAQLCSTRNYKEGNLSRMTFDRMNIAFPHLDLSGQNLTGSVIKDTDCTGTILKDAVVTDCNFSYATGLTVEQIKSTWNYKNGRMAGIVLPKDIAEALQKEKESEKDTKK